MTPEEFEQQRLIDDYFAGRLEEPQIEAFEERLLWDEELQDEVELNRRLREGLAEVVTQRDEQSHGPVNTVPGTASRESGAKARPQPMMPYAWAASVFVALGAGFFLSQVAQGPGQGDRFASGQVYSLEAVRGAPDFDQLPIVRRAAQGAWITLLVYPALGEDQAARAELSRRDEGGQWEPVWQDASLDAVTGEAVAIALRGDVLVPGVYRLGVYAAGSDTGRVAFSEDYFRVAP